MKKTIFTSLAAIALVATATVAPTAVFADDTPADANTTAEFTITAGGKDDTTNPGGEEGTGANKNLWLVKAPDLHFNDTTVAAIIAGTSLTYKDATVTKSVDAADQSTFSASKGVVEVQDLRGNGAGWTLTASVNQPSDGTTALDGTLNLKLASAASDNTATDLGAASVALSTDGTTQNVWSAAAGYGQGKNTAAVDGATSFDIDAEPTVTAGTYDATMTWTLASLPIVTP